jgi:hypothetical protein
MPASRSWTLPGCPAIPVDLITAFDVIHDQVDPAGVLSNVRRALAEDGLFLMIDFKFSSNLEDNIDNPFASLYYGISTMHCMTIALAKAGPGSARSGEFRPLAVCSPRPNAA